MKKLIEYVDFLEITAANRANICSYTVSYEALSQPVSNTSLFKIITLFSRF